jgi:hypothetical protein
MTANQHSCGLLYVRINGRTLKSALRYTKASHKFGFIHDTRWVNVCPTCHAYALGAETTHPWPFVCFDGVMRTVKDLQLKTDHFHSEDLVFCGFSFSRSALQSAIFLARKEFITTKEVERLGGELSGGAHDKVLEFSEKVCGWGRGGRVWGNLKRFNSMEKLERELLGWLKEIAGASDEDAILKGIKIPGLEVSFASKHLRMLDPKKYAVLDSVLSEGLGFALNGKGYQLFLNMLRKFAVDQTVVGNLAELEAGIFLLVRQHVRSKPTTDPESP